MFSIIMCGGSGTRFWPVSRRSKPKQFIDITGNGPMVLETCNRLSPVAGDEEIILLLGRQHLSEARDIFKGRKVHMLAEPVGRNTAACMGLGVIYAQYLGCKEAVAFLPADHFIGDPHSFLDALRAAGKLANSGGIVTLGIMPNRPETGYGYIRRDQEHTDLGKLTAYRVSEFVEKPDIKKALQYLASGEYYWNGGIFVATPETILKEIREQLPDLYRGLKRLTKTFGKEQFEAELRDVYDGLADVSFDYGIMENTSEKVYVLPCECGWSDVGSWASLYELRSEGHDEDQNLADGDTLLIDCESSFISGRGGRLIACLGLKNCLVVDTPEALLVADLNRSQDVRKIVKELKKTEKENLL
ncbi:MAG TPA: nucleotidyl transferase [Desulfobacteraceae bacterium]|nr:nucleotidyl transferase [Desulfobacteraceae bacterium]